MTDDSLPAPISLKYSLSKLIRNRGLVGRSASESLDVEWKRIVGPELGRRSTARRINNGLVEVVVTNGAALEQLRSYLTESALQQLQAFLPQAGIRGIKYLRSS